MALLLNRMHSTESIISHHEIIGNTIEINEMKTPKDIQYNGEFEFSGTRYLSIDSAFPHLENESAKNGDSITIRQEKGLFGYYYVNREQTKIIKK